MGFISYHRAGVAKRQARAAIRASRRLGGALDGVRAQNAPATRAVDPGLRRVKRATANRLSAAGGSARARAGRGLARG